jgi:hypothetical protein
MGENQEIPTFQVVEDVPQYYTNIVRIASHIYDIALVFGKNRPIGATGDASTLESQCIVHMSPAHAKSLCLILRKQLRSYEEQWGRIPVPPDLAEEFGGELYDE